MDRFFFRHGDRRESDQRVLPFEKDTSHSQRLPSHRYSPLDVANTPVDAVTCVGFKWLCGPYGTGFCWMRPEVLESLTCRKAYWLAIQTADELANSKDEIKLHTNLGARAFDVFGTANFFNFKPWTSAIEYLLKQGIQNIASYNESLVLQLLDGLSPAQYKIISPILGPGRSTLVVLSHRRSERNLEIYERLLKEGIHIAIRKGNLRFPPPSIQYPSRYQSGSFRHECFEPMNSEDPEFLTFMEHKINLSN